MKNRIWVVESSYFGEWRWEEIFRTREEARYFQSRSYLPGQSRIRKYVPA